MKLIWQKQVTRAWSRGVTPLGTQHGRHVPERYPGAVGEAGGEALLAASRSGQVGVVLLSGSCGGWRDGGSGHSQAGVEGEAVG